MTNAPEVVLGITGSIGAYGFTGTSHQYAWFVFAFTTAIILGDALSGVGEVETVSAGVTSAGPGGADDILIVRAEYDVSLTSPWLAPLFEGSPDYLDVLIASSDFGDRLTAILLNLFERRSREDLQPATTDDERCPVIEKLSLDAKSGRRP